MAPPELQTPASASLRCAFCLVRASSTFFPFRIGPVVPGRKFSRRACCRHRSCLILVFKRTIQLTVLCFAERLDVLNMLHDRDRILLLKEQFGTLSFIAASDNDADLHCFVSEWVTVDRAYKAKIYDVSQVWRVLHLHLHW